MKKDQNIEMARALLARHGVKRIADLRPDARVAFKRELEQALAGTVPHPADSQLDPTMCEIVRAFSPDQQDG
jgi:hypothetical protein